VRREKLAGSIGLGLFFLFPLVSLLQLRDPDDAWRQVAGRTRPSVIALGDAASPGRPVASAVVISDQPLRVVVAGCLPSPGFRSDTAAGIVTWRPVYTDAAGAFTILTGEALPAGSVSAHPAALETRPVNKAALVPIDPASVGDLEVPEEGAESVAAVLVAPARLEAPILVGELRATRGPDGRPTYRGSRLRVVRGADGVASAEADAAPAVDPALQGAPFVSRNGVVLALYAGERDGVEQAVPMALVREAMARLIPKASER
jgi:hypothetical protein